MINAELYNGGHSVVSRSRSARFLATEADFTEHESLAGDYCMLSRSIPGLRTIPHSPSEAKGYRGSQKSVEFNFWGTPHHTTISNTTSTVSLPPPLSIYFTYM
jgi:hypothetical protein